MAPFREEPSYPKSPIGDDASSSNIVSDVPTADELAIERMEQNMMHATTERKKVFAQMRRSRAKFAKVRAKVIQEQFKDTVFNLRKNPLSEVIRLFHNDLPVSYFLDFIPKYKRRMAMKEKWGVIYK